jgi:hypothetical protein
VKTADSVVGPGEPIVYDPALTRKLNTRNRSYVGSWIDRRSPAAAQEMHVDPKTLWTTKPTAIASLRKLNLRRCGKRFGMTCIYAASLLVVVRGRRHEYQFTARRAHGCGPARWHDKGGLMRGGINRPTIAVVALLAALCLAPRDQAASTPDIDASVSATLEGFFREVWSGQDLAN